jgi:hypothetical protein
MMPGIPSERHFFILLAETVEDEENPSASYFSDSSDGVVPAQKGACVSQLSPGPGVDR